jgi:4-amino-4-deoxy-L-arabinose transferase-like glycosyltransferase
MSQVYEQPDGDAGSQPRRDVVEGEVVDLRTPAAAGAEDFFAMFRARQRTVRPSSCIGGAALIVLCLLVFLPGFFALPPVDRDESRFAQASRQMYESVALQPALRTPALHDGGLIIPKLQDKPRLNKPPLIYWAQSLSAAIFSRGNPYRDAIWMYRIPSLLAAIGTVLVVYRLGSSMFDRRTGWLAAALLAVAPVIAWEAHQARADMLLLFLTTLSMSALWHCFTHYQSRERKRADSVQPSPLSSWRAPLTFWTTLALAILTKGPIAPLIVLISILTLCLLSRQSRWLINTKPLLGIPLLLLITLPWFWTVADRVGWDTYWSIFKGETIHRSISAKEGHWAPPGYHTLLLPVLFWPGSLLTAAAIALAWKAARGPRAASRLRWTLTDESAPYALSLAWILPSWLFFELISTKLPHYTMPLYPAIAILSARAVLVAQANALPTATLAARVGHVVWIAIGALLLAGSLALIAWRTGAAPNVFSVLIAVVLAAVAVQSFRMAWKAGRAGRILRAQLAGLAAAVPLLIIGVGLNAPRILNLPRSIQGELLAIDPSQSRPLAAVGYHEDSLLFTTRARVQRLDAADLDAWAHSNPEGLLIMTAPSPAGFAPVAAVRGFNIAKGRMVDLVIAERRP